MRKYLKTIQTAVIYSSIYRVEIILSLAQSAVTPAFMLLALSSARSNSISWNQLIPYYVLVALTFPIFRSQIDEDIGELAASGDVANFIVKPVSPYLFFLSQEAGKKVVSLITLLPLLILAFLFFHYTVPSLVPIAFSLLVSFLINYNLSYLIGLGSFWLDEFWVLSNLRHVVITLLGGLVLPYSFFPQEFVSLLKYTPFPYTLNFSTRIITGNVSTSEYIIAALWVIILYALIKLVEKSAISKYSFVAN